ncbi:hypothetical protein ACROYT_G010436 [Oculina patagonica]
MEALGEDLDEDSDVAENRLLNTEDSCCVCSKVWEKDFICGWAPSFERKVSRKPTKHAASLGNTRKDGKIALAECGFVFRHYEKSSRYIEQYRENHSSTFLQSEDEWRPVLGVDVPDPYLPKIGSTSSKTVFDRVKFIEAMSDYYKVAAMRSDLQNICLTGKRTENADRKTASSSDTKLNSDGLPFIVTASNGKQVSQKAGKRKLSTTSDEEKLDTVKNRQDVIRTAPELTKDIVLPCVGSKPDVPHQMDDKPISSSAKHQSSEESRRFQKERIRLPKFQWTECHVKNNRRERERNNATVKVEKKEKPIVETLPSSDSEENVLLSTRQLNSRGNLHLGSTVSPPTSKSKSAHVAVGKCEIFSSTKSSSAERRPKPYQTGTKLPSETAFIRILGQQTGPPPKEASKNGSKEANKERPSTNEKAFMNQNLPLQYMSRFGRRKFQHVLEARSFKPAEKKLRATALADFHN